MPTTKYDLERWIVDALRTLGGDGTIVEICAHVWKNREPDLRGAGDLFYTWQYDIRWAAQRLRDTGVLRPDKEVPRGHWVLAG